MPHLKLADFGIAKAPDTGEQPTFHGVGLVLVYFATEIQQSAEYAIHFNLKFMGKADA